MLNPTSGGNSFPRLYDLARVEVLRGSPQADSEARPPATAWSERCPDEFLMAATAQNLRRMAKWLMPGSKQINLSSCVTGNWGESPRQKPRLRRALQLKYPAQKPTPEAKQDFFNRIGRTGPDGERLRSTRY
jgi:hypothetical protein